VAVSVYGVVALTIGFATGWLRYAPASWVVPRLLFSLFIFSALFEEAFSRGMLIPRDILNRGSGQAIVDIRLSTLLFVLAAIIGVQLTSRCLMQSFLV
jgi:membrane protease YdiL (CAAX protease family)